MANKHPYRSLKGILLACMILVPVIPFITSLLIGYSHFMAALETRTIATMKRVVEDHRTMIESFLRERKSDLEFIVSTHEFEDLHWPQRVKGLFRSLQRGSNAFVDLGAFNEEGVHMSYYGPFQLTGKVYAEADWFKEVMKQGFYISDIFLGYRRIPHFVIAIRGEDATGKWVLRATVDSNLFNNLVKKVRIGKTGEAYLLNAGGVFQTERRSGGELMKRDQDTLDQVARHEGIRTFLNRSPSGVEYLYATTWLEDKPWMLVVRQEKSDAFEALQKASALIIIVFVLGVSGIVGTAFFLTNRIIRRMEGIDMEKDTLGEQLVRATRLAELGEMAAGFAHEINNPLQIMKSEQALMETILEELREEGKLSDSEEVADLRDSMAQVGIQIDRCARITQAILKFGRQSEPSRKDVDVPSFIPEVVTMVEKKASVHGIELDVETPNQIPPVHVDPSQLQQVLVNLLNNAVDAVVARHGSQGGHIRIQANASTDGHVELVVQDNGIGIRPEDQEKIFRPFFTTKPVGKGTGLGLSVCYGIVNAMGGTMGVSSTPGEGTAFTIQLPAVSRGREPRPGTD